MARCAVYLRKYNDALLINDTLRMIDAFRYLEDFNVSQTDAIVGITEVFLEGLFRGRTQTLKLILVCFCGFKFMPTLCRHFAENQAELRELANNPLYANPRMSELQNILLERFGPDLKSRGIIFSKTRLSTLYLKDWICTNAALEEAGVKADILTGAGNGNAHMTLVCVISNNSETYLLMFVLHLCVFARRICRKTRSVVSVRGNSTS